MYLTELGSAFAEVPAERRTVRCVASSLKRRRQEAGKTGPHVASLDGEVSIVTGGFYTGDASTHIAHAWDASFTDLVACIAKDAAGDLDRLYTLDLFTADLQSPPEDPVAAVQNLIARTGEVLLVLDAEGKALSRLWVLFEALLALGAGKLRIRCSAPQGFGASEKELLQWEERIDAIDWILAKATRRADEDRLRAFAKRTWDAGGKGMERRQAQLKLLLRREAYGQILLGAIARGDRGAVEAALEKGAKPDQQDALGSTAEELASFYGREDIADLLFERRMRGMSHRSLSSFFTPRELVAACESASADALAPFLTEPELSEGSGMPPLLGATRLSEQSESTHTPGSSGRGWRSGGGRSGARSGAASVRGSGLSDGGSEDDYVGPPYC